VLLSAGGSGTVLAKGETVSPLAVTVARKAVPQWRQKRASAGASAPQPEHVLVIVA
jgi:hypothetical protein